MKKREIDPVLIKLKEATNTFNDADMCKFLGISYGTLDTWKNKDHIPEKRLFEISKKLNVDYDWLTGVEDESNVVALPYYPETYAGAGGGAFQYLENSEPMSFTKDFLELHLGLKKYKKVFIINATGDSMEPTFGNGALLFVNPYENEDEKLRDGAVYVIHVDDTVLVKRVTYNPLDQSHMLISDNAVYGSIKVYKFNESAKFIGRVVGFFDRV